VKQALVQAKLSEKHTSIRTSTYGIVFFGTPHQGGNHAKLGDIAATVVKTVLRNPNNTFMESLRKDSLYSEELIQNFRHQLEDYYVLSFFETRPFKKFGLIVDKKSATLGLSDTRETQIALDADHNTVCKFASPDGDDYEQVSGNVVFLAESAIKALTERQRLAGLGVPEAALQPEPEPPVCT